MQLLSHLISVPEARFGPFYSQYLHSKATGRIFAASKHNIIYYPVSLTRFLLSKYFPSCFSLLSYCV